MRLFFRTVPESYGYFKRLWVALILFFVCSTSAEAFNGSRKGLVAGGGIGHAVNSHWGKSETAVNENQGGVGLNFLVGYGLNTRNMLVFEMNITGYASEAEWGTGAFIGLSNQSIMQGFVGVNWYHYYPVTGLGEFFTSFGVGIYSFDVEGLDANTPGRGGLLGLGYVYRRHFQLGLYFGGGRSSAGSADFTHSHVNILVSAIAF